MESEVVELTGFEPVFLACRAGTPPLSYSPVNSRCESFLAGQDPGVRQGLRIDDFAN